MQTKLLSTALIAICSITIGHAQNEIYQLKSKPAPFEYKNYKAPLVFPKLFKPLPFINWKKNNAIDSANYSHQTNQGDVLIAPQDGMPILKPYPQSTYHERTSILNPYLPATSGKQSYVYPMPNPLNKALIVE